MQAAIANPNKALWEKGDFTEIAAFMRQSGEAVVHSLRITPPLRVLDLGSGDGTTAVPLARTGAEVMGIDIARSLVEAGNKRAAEAGLVELKFQEGDASNLEGVADHTFDMTVSVFGAMFATQALRCRQGDGARYQTGRSHRNGQLDSKRSDIRIATTQDQLSVYASTAGRLRKSYDLGCGESHH
jgi:SAM-dependent methyltransferase